MFSTRPAGTTKVPVGVIQVHIYCTIHYGFKIAFSGYRKRHDHIRIPHRYRASNANQTISLYTKHHQAPQSNAVPNPDANKPTDAASRPAALIK